MPLFRLSHLPIQKKLTLTLSAASLFGLFLILFAILTYEVNTFKPRILNSLEAEGKIISTAIYHSLMFNDEIAATEALKTIKAMPQISYAVVYNLDGSYFASYQKKNHINKEKKIQNPLITTSRYVSFTKKELLLVLPIIHQEETLGFIYLCRDLPSFAQRLPQYSIVIFTGGIVLIISAFILTVGLRRLITTPVLNLASVARQVIEKRDYTLRVKSERKDEIGKLADVFNDMLSTTSAELEAHKEIAKALRDSEAKLTQFLDHLPIGVLVVDENGKALYINNYAEKLLGFTHVYHASLQHPAAWHAVVIGTNKTYPQETFPVSIALKGKETKADNIEIEYENHRITIEMTASPIYDQDKFIQYAIITIIDISERLQAQADIRFLANHDPLTNLANRRSFHSFLETALNDAKKNNLIVGLLFIDLDQFKSINDSLGHDIADELLRIMGKRLKDSTRQADIVARLGGDEFAVILTHLKNSAKVMDAANHIQHILSKPYALGNKEIYATASIGVSLFPAHSQEAADLIRFADTAMYAVKKSGRNNAMLYNDEMAKLVFGRIEIISELRQAIERKEFELYYQPKLNIKTRELVGAEALIRWNHPQQGLMHPADFIPFAEDSGLITEISIWSIRDACLQLKKWHEKGFLLRSIALNLSAIQFRDQKLAANIIKIILDTGLDPKYIEFEITESLFLDNRATASATLCELQKAGIQISIDDFGTGYSSLAYLRRLPINTLKIDQTFISNLINDNDNTAIITAILALGRRLNLKVIAEGVHTEEEAFFLEQQGCDEMQGYLISRPLNAHGFEQYVYTHHLKSISNVYNHPEPHVL